MNKIFNYQKVGPGVSKDANPQSGFWRIYKAKFFQLLGFNLILTLCLAVVIGIAWVPLNSVFDTDNSYVEKLESKYNINDSYISVINRMLDAYKIDEEQFGKAYNHIEKVVKLFNEKNPEALNDPMDASSLVGFDSRKFTDEELKLVADELIEAFKKLEFKVDAEAADESGKIYHYKLIDSSKNEVARVTYTYVDKESDVINLEHRFPYSVSKTALLLLCFLPIILLGPVRLGVTRITRDYVRGEPAFMFSDLWDTIKKNWWQSFVISFIEYISVGCAIISLVWYYTYIISGIFFIIGFAGCLLLSYIFISMNFYVPMMQVTLNLNLRKIYKNAFFFTVICMLKNVWMILVTAVIIVACFLMMVVGMGEPFILPIVVFFVLTLPLSFWIYFISYNTYPAVKKYVIDPYYEELNKDDEDSTEKAVEATVSDNVVSNETNVKTETEDNDLPEYVYHNGRMVHRSVLEQESLFEDDVTNNDD